MMRCEGVICRSRRIQSSRYEIGLQMQKASVGEMTYVSLVRVLLFFVVMGAHYLAKRNFSSRDLRMIHSRDRFD